MPAILEFISTFQSPSNYTLFTEIACYWFAVILQERFPNSKIVYNPHSFHFATQIDNEVYDITGLVSDTEDYLYWDYYKSRYDTTVIEECCIKLKRM